MPRITEYKWRDIGAPCDRCNGRTHSVKLKQWEQDGHLSWTVEDACVNKSCRKLDAHGYDSRLPAFKRYQLIVKTHENYTKLETEEAIEDLIGPERFTLSRKGCGF